MLRGVISCIAALGSAAAVAAETTAALPEPPALDAPQVLSVLLGLVAVLALFGGLVWVLKRAQATRLVRSQRLEVVGGLSFGMRDRVVLVKADRRNVLLAVGSQGIQALSEWDEGESGENFSERLSESRARLAGGAS